MFHPFLRGVSLVGFLLWCCGLFVCFWFCFVLFVFVLPVDSFLHVIPFFTSFFCNSRKLTDNGCARSAMQQKKRQSVLSREPYTARHPSGNRTPCVQHAERDSKVQEGRTLQGFIHRCLACNLRPFLPKSAFGDPLSVKVRSSRCRSP